MTYDTIIFDLDGTLIHSAPDLQAALNHALSDIGREALDLPTVISFIGNGVEKLVARGLKTTGKLDEPLQAQALATFLAFYEQNATTLTRPYPGVVEALERFCVSGMKLGVCTNKPTAPARAICEALDLAKYFAVINGAEQGQPKKPDAKPLLDCVAKLASKPETTLYVGDSAVDYQTALNAKIPFRLFASGYLNEALPELSETRRFDDWNWNEIL